MTKCQYVIYLTISNIKQIQINYMTKSHASRLWPKICNYPARGHQAKRPQKGATKL